MSNTPDVKENDKHAPDFSIGRIVALSEDLTINPALIKSDNPGQQGCIIRGDLTNFLAEVDTLLLLIHSEITSGPIHNSKQKGIINLHIQPDA
jgi:hypothetical protein